MAAPMTDADRAGWCRQQAEKLGPKQEGEGEPHEFTASQVMAAAFLAMAARIQKRTDRKEGGQ